jgi:hypothetical protein
MAAQIDQPEVVENIEIEEEWRIVAGFDNYEVSDLGRVRNRITGYVLTPQIHHGYLQVALGRGNVKPIHKLVATAFLGDSEGRLTDHISRVRTDNRVVNLRYVNARENCQNRTRSNGIEYEFLNELPEDAEPLTEYHGRDIEPGYYRNGNEFYVQVVNQYKRIPRIRNYPGNPNSWRVIVRAPDNRKITISWVE